MDISEETSIEKLKALAYDQISIVVNGNQAQENLNVINGRIAELQLQEAADVQREEKQAKQVSKSTKK